MRLSRTWGLTMLLYVIAFLLDDIPIKSHSIRSQWESLGVRALYWLVLTQIYCFTIYHLTIKAVRNPGSPEVNPLSSLLYLLEGAHVPCLLASSWTTFLVLLETRRIASLHHSLPHLLLPLSLWFLCHTQTHPHTHSASTIPTSILTWSLLILFYKESWNHLDNTRSLPNSGSWIILAKSLLLCKLRFS